MTAQCCRGHSLINCTLAGTQGNEVRTCSPTWTPSSRPLGLGDHEVNSGLRLPFKVQVGVENS
jgi:hypothetical protein